MFGEKSIIVSDICRSAGVVFSEESTIVCDICRSAGVAFSEASTVDLVSGN